MVQNLLECKLVGDGKGRTWEQAQEDQVVQSGMLFRGAEREEGIIMYIARGRRNRERPGGLIIPPGGDAIFRRSLARLHTSMEYLKYASQTNRNLCGFD